MAKFVTRTFKGTVAEILVYKTDEKETGVMTVFYTKKFKDEKSLEKFFTKQHKDDNIRFVAILSMQEREEKRTMTAQHFYEESYCEE